jgi:hypothetical protein
MALQCVGKLWQSYSNEGVLWLRRASAASKSRVQGEAQQGWRKGRPQASTGLFLHSAIALCRTSQVSRSVGDLFLLVTPSANNGTQMLHGRMGLGRYVVKLSPHPHVPFACESRERNKDGQRLGRRGCLAWEKLSPPPPYFTTMCHHNPPAPLPGPCIAHLGVVEGEL